jgi:hypothetical protein
MVRMTPQPDTGEVLAGLVERVTYHNAENGFCVLRTRARGHRDVVTVVGHAAAVAAIRLALMSKVVVIDRRARRTAGIGTDFSSLRSAMRRGGSRANIAKLPELLRKA